MWLVLAIFRLITDSQTIIDPYLILYNVNLKEIQREVDDVIFGGSKARRIDLIWERRNIRLMHK